jgi:hypothetical protein
LRNEKSHPGASDELAMRSKLQRLLDVVPRLLKLDRQIDDLKINQGRILGELLREHRADTLHAYEFKVFSQWGEDGIIQFLISNLEIAERTFIEFGVEDFVESNCRYLLMKDNWRGFVIDGSPVHIERLRASYFYWQHRLDARASFITRENVGQLLAESGFGHELGILSIDLDGVDYHVLEALSAWRPSILVVEYNAIFGFGRPVSIPYEASFRRTRKHHSNQYWGASLTAFCHLAQQRGYALVGTNSVGSNAFFVRRDLLNERVREVTVDSCAREASFRDSRDAQGNLNFLDGVERRRVIADLPLVDVVTGAELRVADLDR